MSKVCYFLLTTFFILFFLAIKTTPVFADEWEISADTDNVTTDTQQLSVFFKNKTRANFFINPPYGVVVWKGDASHNNPNDSCRVHSKLPLTNLKLAYPDDKSVAIVTWNLDKIKGDWPAFSRCLQPNTGWTIRLIEGDVSIPANTESSSIPDFTFNLNSPSGKSVTIKSVENPPVIYKDDPRGNPDNPQAHPPQIIINNASPNQKYIFWWEKERVISDTYPPRDSNNLISADPLTVIQLPKFDFNSTFTDNDKPLTQKKLCFAYGEPWPGDQVPWNDNSCNEPGRSILFKIDRNQRPLPTAAPSPTPPIPGQPPPSNKPAGICDLYAAHLEEVAETDTVIVGYKEALPNQEFTATLQPDGGPTDKKGKSNENGRILIKVADRLKVNSYTVSIIDSNNHPICTKLFSVTKAGSSPAPVAPCDKTADCTFSGNNSSCDTNDSRGPGIRTAVGCIHTSPPELVKDVMTFMLGISGGLAFLMMLLGAFQMLTSAGNPETLHAGRERLTSAIIGLLIVIFATLLLQIIGVDILRIPGFG